MKPRIAAVEPPYLPEIASDLAKLMPPGMEPLALFRVVAQNPRVLGRFRRGGLLDPGSISLREREIVVLRTTARCGSEYEWGVHAAFFGAAAGLGDAQLKATVHGGAADSLWTPRERLLIELSDALHDSATIGDELWSRLAAEFEAPQLIELVVLAGLYHMVSFVTNATRVPNEAAALPFPA